MKNLALHAELGFTEHLTITLHEKREDISRELRRLNESELRALCVYDGLDIWVVCRCRQAGRNGCHLEEGQRDLGEMRCKEGFRSGEDHLDNFCPFYSLFIFYPFIYVLAAMTFIKDK